MNITDLENVLKASNCINCLGQGYQQFPDIKRICNYCDGNGFRYNTIYIETMINGLRKHEPNTS